MLFVIGDVHLYAGSDPALAADLAGLVRALTQRAAHCCIVFNGDLFDLDRVGGEPDAGIGPQAAAARVRRVLEAFPQLTLSLQEHLEAGGQLQFLAGNHDAELLWPAAEAALRDCVKAPSSAPSQLIVAETGGRPPVLIEHGHQADPDACFFPNPRQAIQKARLSAFPLASLITRLLLSHIPRFELMGDNYRTPLGVLARVVRDYRWHALKMIIRYPIAGVGIAWHGFMARLRNDASPKSSMSSPWAAIQRLYLDRYFATLAVIVLGIVAVFGSLHEAGWWLLVLLGIYLALPPRGRRRRFDRRDARAGAQEALDRIANGASVVVQGHSHRSFVKNVGAATYANHGAFSLPSLLDDGRRRGRPYLAITAERQCEVEFWIVGSE